MEPSMKNVSNKEENYELNSKMEITKQKCHICDSHFENLDIHFLTSHEPIENSSYKTRTEVFDNSLEQTGLQCSDSNTMHGRR